MFGWFIILVVTGTTLYYTGKKVKGQEWSADKKDAVLWVDRNLAQSARRSLGIGRISDGEK